MFREKKCVSATADESESEDDFSNELEASLYGLRPVVESKGKKPTKR